MIVLSRARRHGDFLSGSRMQHNILSGEGRGTTSSVKHGGRVMSSVKQGDGLTT